MIIFVKMIQRHFIGAYQQAKERHQSEGMQDEVKKMQWRAWQKLFPSSSKPGQDTSTGLGNGVPLPLLLPVHALCPPQICSKGLKETPTPIYFRGTQGQEGGVPLNAWLSANVDTSQCLVSHVTNKYKECKSGQLLILPRICLPFKKGKAWIMFNQIICY